MGSGVATRARTEYKVTPAMAQAWGTCGGFFQARHVGGGREPQSYASLLGTAVHELAVAYDRTQVEDARTVERVLGRAWRRGRFAADEEARAQEEAQELLGVYARVRAAETVQVLASECFCQNGRRSVGECAAIVLSGRLDRVARLADGTLEVLDLKTGGALPSEDELRADLATTVYYLLAAERFGSERIVVAQLSVRTGARVEVTLTEGDLQAGKEQLREMVRQMAGGAYTLQVGMACGYCPARGGCPALSNRGTVADAPF